MCRRRSGWGSSGPPASAAGCALSLICVHTYTHTHHIHSVLQLATCYTACLYTVYILLIQHCVYTGRTAERMVCMYACYVHTLYMQVEQQRGAGKRSSVSAVHCMYVCICVSIFTTAPCIVSHGFTPPLTGSASVHQHPA